MKTPWLGLAFLLLGILSLGWMGEKVFPSILAPEEKLPVLLYHMITPADTSANGAVVPLKEFEAQMAELSRLGYRSLTLAEFQTILSGGEVPKKRVLITFDDGYRSTLTLALPVLKKYGFTAVEFVIGDRIGYQSPEVQYMTLAELKEGVASGALEIGFHTMYGHRYDGDKPALLGWDKGQTAADLRLEKETLATAGIPTVEAFAYPWGAYTEANREALREEGMRAAFTVERRSFRPGDDPLAIPRLIVFPGMSLKGFRGLLGK
ncbi:MAG: polysaccharide deacetylase family protein [Bacillota bacterium]|nr:polysaccharide deacetylase family protein [Bacillota bacterium]